MRRVRSFLGIVVVVLAGIFLSTPAEAGTPSPTPSPTSAPALDAKAKIGGAWAPVTVGTIVAQGIVSDENCKFDPPLEISGGDGVEVGVHVDGDCVAAVDVVAMSTGSTPPTDVHHEPLPQVVAATADPVEAPAPSVLASPVNHYMWARAVVLEQFGVTATYVYVEMKYTRDGTLVYNGNSPAYDDYNSGWPCWTVTPEAYNWSTTGPTSVFIYRRTHFYNCSPPHPDYDLSARATADPGARHSCNTPVVPKFWDVRCYGATYY